MYTLNDDIYEVHCNSCGWDGYETELEMNTISLTFLLCLVRIINYKIV